MRYELQIVTDAADFPTAEALLAAVTLRGTQGVRVAASGGFDGAGASPRLLVEDAGGARVLLGFEGEEHARFLAEGLKAAPPPLLERLDGYDEAVLSRARTAYRLSVNSAGDTPADAVRLQVQLADALLEHTTRGILLDSQMQLLWGAARWRQERAMGDVDVRRHVIIHAEPADSGFWMHTHGLIKFDRPDLEIFGVPEALIEQGAALLNHFARHLASGGVLRAGETAALPGGAQVRFERGARPPHDFEGEALHVADHPADAARHVTGALAAFPAPEA